MTIPITNPATRTRIARQAHGVRMLVFRTALRLSALGLAGVLAGMTNGSVAALPALRMQAQIVLSSDAAPYKQADAGIRQALEAKSEVRSARLDEFDAEQLRKLGSTGEGMVIAIGTPAAVKLHQSLPPETRLVYCMVSDPERAGLTSGRSTPGVSVDVPVPDQVAVLQRAMPKLRKVGVLYRAASGRSTSHLDALRAALVNKIEVIAVDADKHKDVAEAIHELIAAAPDVIWTFADTNVFDATTTKALLKDTLSAKIPVFGFSLQFVRAGALFGVGVRPEDQAAQTAELASRIMAGESVPGQSVPPQMRLGVNTAVAQRMGLTLADAFMRTVDETFGD